MEGRERIFDSMPSPDENPQKRSRPAEAQPEVTQTPKRRRDEQDEDYQIGRGFYPPFVYQKEEQTWHVQAAEAHCLEMCTGQHSICTLSMPSWKHVSGPSRNMATRLTLPNDKLLAKSFLSCEHQMECSKTDDRAELKVPD